METIIQYFNDGYKLTDLLICIIIIVSIIVCIEKGIVWLYKKFLVLYKRKKGEEEELSTIDKNTYEIKRLNETIDNLAILINKQYRHLDKKIDEQKERLTTLDEEGQKRDCAILRDRILGGMRYFCQNRDDNGVVHINITDHENMEHLFEAYFSCHGNGTVKTMYDNEFKNWIIDK